MNNFDCHPIGTVWYLYYYFKSPTTDYLSDQLRKFKKDSKAQLEAFSELAAEALLKADLELDYIIRPLGSTEISAKKPNRVRDLALAISRVTGGVYNPLLLAKKKHTRALKQLNLAERRNELKEVYVLSDKVDLNNKKVLIVDDIATTGTTFGVIGSLIMLKYPNAKIYGFCLAKTSSLQFEGVSENEDENVTHYKEILKKYM